MAVLHEEVVCGRKFQVRSAGRTLRLYVDGVLHTSYSPVRPLTGAVWDPLALAAFLMPTGSVRRCLVLGVGGGAAIHLLRRHVAPETIVGLEFDPVIASIAREWFDVEGPGIELIEADATRWVRDVRVPPFDLVLDDLFEELDGEPVRNEGTDDRRWYSRVRRLVAPGGVLVANFGSEGDLYSSSLCQDVSLRIAFPAAFHFSFPGYENAVAALMRVPVSRATLRRRLARHPVLGRAAARRLMRFRVHRLWPD